MFNPKKDLKENPYNNHSWRKLRDRFISENPLCFACADRNIIKEATQADHIIPWTTLNGHFLNNLDLMALCASCHSSITAIQSQIDFGDISIARARELKLELYRPVEHIGEDGYVI